MASAYPVSLAYQGVPNAVVVGIAGDYTGNVYAGNYTVSYSTDPSTIISGFCVEPQATNTQGVYTPYDLGPIAEGSGYEAAAYVLSKGYTGASAQAAQVAVWELTWDYQLGNSFSLTSDHFQLTSPDPNAIPTPAFVTDVTNIYNDAIAHMGAGFDQSGYVLATNASYQNFVLPNPVPVPASILLMGSGLVGISLLGFRRRRRD